MGGSRLMAISEVNYMGGIVPTEALTSHQEHLAKLVDKSLASLPLIATETCDSKILHLRNGERRQKPDFVSVTRGPGMQANLGVGVNTAKGLATAWQIPIVGAHHMQGHTLTSRLVDAVDRDAKRPANSIQPAFPFLTLLVSGGHTMLVYSEGLVKHKIIATTKDNAIGDELDKCGRMILPKHVLDSLPDTGYAKYLSEYAFGNYNFEDWLIPQSRSAEIDKPLTKFGWKIPIPMVRNRELAFTFGGISSTVRKIVSNQTGDLQGRGLCEEERLMLARMAIGAAFDSLGSRIIIALEMLRDRGVEISTLVVSGGVAANDFLRFHLRRTLDARKMGHVGLNFPPVELCTDNAAMIGWAGIEMFEAGYHSDMAFQPQRSWSMDSEAEDGGILGIGGWRTR
ncbi:O-sialoglycoprotein endopeptidase [Exophiala aquamarina CBS 119918]|uniref:N(6)-L-threonylcarbamoyladenine synthase n=1 Tax=Exophiala aquamarina CBS 119918 TaxID=1182545 RepID=A0A072PK32_9EURO|nr:O-sialoglycoprotein endopeptidase [Exophiala aquamarina CBS 119918]KEF60117.1 O-sialoglycoprotein endopeptidase [Exophiala aquamarina CBS 119918]